MNLRYCPACGVFVRATDLQCPLCGKPTIEGGTVQEGEKLPEQPPPVSGGEVSVTGNSDPYGEMKNLSRGEKRFIMVELLSVFSGIAVVVTLLVDLFTSHRIGWSLYALFGIIAFWLMVNIPLLLYRHPWIVVAVLAPSTPLLVFIFDVLDGKITWFLPFGFPIAILTELSLVLTGLFIGIMKRKGLNIFAVLLLGTTLFCVGLEGILSLNFQGRLLFSWSVVVALSCVPMAGILFYLHYRIMHQASLRKLFRL
ncbi:MAG: zinc ribbon domain-containing protein [Treponemataceae bacterium]|nr:zinc ribbon domain-containing protein [Treponemataceae bacterium]